MTETPNEIMWIDSNDTLNTLTSILPKDLSNVVHGVQTYGFSETLLYTETAIYELWLLFAEQGGVGLGFGLLGSAFLTRLIFVPPTIYSVSSFQP